LVGSNDAESRAAARARRRAFAFSLALHATAIAAVVALAAAPLLWTRPIEVTLLVEPQTATQIGAAPVPPQPQVARPVVPKPTPTPKPVRRERAATTAPKAEPAPVANETPNAAEAPPAPVATAASAGPAADRIFGEGEVDSVAAPLGAIAPRYPSRERMLGKQGTVVLDVTVDAGGRVRALAVAKSAGEGFDAAARSAVEATPFRAAQREGRAVASRVTVRVKFQLD
jgi:protein TonB